MTTFRLVLDLVATAEILVTLVRSITRALAYYIDNFTLLSISLNGGILTRIPAMTFDKTVHYEHIVNIFSTIYIIRTKRYHKKHDVLN